MEDSRRRTDDNLHAEMRKLKPCMLVAAALRKKRVESTGRHWTGNRPLPGKRTAFLGSGTLHIWIKPRPAHSLLILERLKNPIWLHEIRATVYRRRYRYIIGIAG